jgi:Ser/Thr protein kinase RdoA (MazF antagonist)
VTEHGIIFTLHRAFEPHPDLGVVRPVACFPEWLSLVTEECAGQSVAALFQNAKVYSPRRGAEQLSAVCLRAGNWLRLFQDWTAQSEGMVNLEEIVEYVRVRLDVLALHAESEFDSRRREQIARLVATLLSQVRPNELKMVGRHNDYAPNNMLVANNRLTVLDFGGFNYGPIYRDICKFWFKLEELQIGFLVSARTVSMAQQAFWSGYGTRVDLSHPLCVAIKIAYGLDKLGDMLADWNRTPFFKRPALRQLYAHYTDYIRATGHRLGI